MPEKSESVNKYSNANVAMALDILGVNVLITRSAVYVSARDVGADDYMLEIPDDVVFLHQKGTLLPDDICISLRLEKWCRIQDVSYKFQDEFYQALHRNIMNLSLLLRHSPIQICPLYKSFFDLWLYEDLSVSSDGRLYLSYSQVCNEYGVDVIRCSLGHSGDNPQTVLNNAVGAYCEGLRSASSRALHRYQMVPWELLPMNYRDKSLRGKQVIFYPYSTLLCVGLPSVEKYENAINTGCYGLHA